MTRTDRKIIFTALAFLTVAIKGKGTADGRKSDEVQQLAELVESYCDENVVQVSAPVSEEPGALVSDQIIERHIRELCDNEETRLPEDRQTLIKIVDRLEQRKSRRMRREFYASATERQVADLALELLDDEIEDKAKLA